MDAYVLPYLALIRLIDAGISCNACLMVSFSTQEAIESAKQKLGEIHAGILKSLELEKIKLFPKVRERLRKHRILEESVGC